MQKTQQQLSLQQKETLKENMASVYLLISKRNTAGITVDSAIPLEMRRQFYRQLETYDQTMSTALANQTVDTFEQTDHLAEGCQQTVAELGNQVNRLSNTVQKNEQAFQRYHALRAMPEYPYYLFLSNEKTTTCHACSANHGNLLSLEDLMHGNLIPPLHVNCGCRLVALDGRMAQEYYKQSALFTLQIEKALYSSDFPVGNLFYLKHTALQAGITPTQIERIDPSSSSFITQNGYKSPEWVAAFMDWATTFVSDALEYVDAFFLRGQNLFINASEAIDTNPLLGLILFADAFALGLPSAVIEVFEQRWQLVEDRQDLWSCLNFLTFGLGELLDGTFEPEKPWSFEHALDAFGLATYAYGAVKLMQVADGSTAAPSSAGAMDDNARATLPQQLDDTMDDIARGLGEVESIVSAEEANLKHLQKHPTYEPPCLPKTNVYQVRLAQPGRYARVFGGNSPQVNRWILNLDDIVGLSAKEIKDKFSLPEEPTHICDVDVPTDTLLEISGANGIIGNKGGGIQYEFVIDPPKSWFTNSRALP